MILKQYIFIYFPISFCFVYFLHEIAHDPSENNIYIKSKPLTRIVEYELYRLKGRIVREKPNKFIFT